MLFHVSRDRWDAIQSRSYHLGGIMVAHDALPGPTSGDDIYHILDSSSHCNACDGDFESIPVSTPVELEEFKLKTAASNEALA